MTTRDALPAVDDAPGATCEGWRRDRACTDSDGRRLPDPHPGCLNALYRLHVARLNEG